MNPEWLIYADNHLLVVNKPAGIPTQVSLEHPQALESRVKQWVKETYQKIGNVFLQPIHRLDLPVSGVTVFARTSKALSRCQAQMRSRSGRKIYLALLENLPPASHGTLKHLLVHDTEKRCARLSKEGKEALLHYQVLDADKKLVQIELITGRYHQIRCQFAAIGCPIRGDRKYGAHSTWHAEAIALHHSEMQMLHPVTKQLLHFQAQIPSPEFLGP